MERKDKTIKYMRIIISAGGTGGHIFPALSVADALKKAQPDTEILFVGALGRMEMERVPAQGYNIIGLPIAGFQRQLNLKNLWLNFQLPIKILSSLLKVRGIIKNFKPDVVVGFGGYASGPTLRAAAAANIPTVLQEQNSYAGITNKILARNAKKICVAYPDMEKYLPAEKIIFTGNPVRAEISVKKNLKNVEASKYFNLDASKKTIAILGGSLGARTLNNILSENFEFWKSQDDVQIIWQCGKFHFENLKNSKTASLPNVKLMPFVQQMNFLYDCADAIITRSGALTVSELCIVGIPTIFVPSPNVAEDHQTKNAMALVDKQAALFLTDATAQIEAPKLVIDLLKNENLCAQLKKNMQSLAKPNAATEIADIIRKIAQ